MMNSRIAVFLLIFGFLASCSALDTSAASDTYDVGTETPSPSPTIVWFPPSATPSPQFFPTQAPTPEMRPGLGVTTLTDDFSSASLWDIAKSDQGSASMDGNHLTLAAQPAVYMISIRHNLALGNFYAEITASPNLCRGNDAYGFLVRANSVAYYQFGLSCNGYANAERRSVGTRAILHRPVPSGDVPSGVPGKVRIGVWAVGTEMRLFLNGRYQFSINDSNYSVGTVGVFAHSDGNTPVTVNFSDLVIQDVSYILPTITPLP